MDTASLFAEMDLLSKSGNVRNPATENFKPATSNNTEFEMLKRFKEAIVLHNEINRLKKI